MERMKELTVAIQDEYEGKVVYRTNLYTEEEYKKLEEENKELKERIRFLEECLDNKEKVNKSMREEIEIWKLTAKDYAKQCGVDLEKEVEK